ncbi:MAG: hypothetical protein ACREQI_06660 [Candidatus Binataceae bacterium]
MRWRAAQIGGETYGLGHLDEFDFEFVVPAKDNKPEQVYRINVIFSMHCFTRGIRDGESYRHELTYSDSRETRLFDTQRYRLSMRLPGIVRGIGTRRCFHTGHGNFFTIEVVDDDGTRLDYSVYFKVSRRSKRGWLNLYIESAYVQGKIPRRRPHPPRPIRFSVIAYNVAMGRPIKEPM